MTPVPVSARLADDVTPADRGLVETLTETIPALLRAQHIPGLGIALARRDRVIWEAGFGYADLATRRPMTPQTVFRSGSMAKTYTATAVMQLVEQGVVALDAPINDYLPFRVENPLGAREITVADLMTHRSGLMGNGATSRFVAPRPLEQFLAEDIAAGRLDLYRGQVRKWTAPVGAQYQYSNTGLALLGLIVARTNESQRSFGGYVQANIIEPLGMTSTYFPDGDDTDPSAVPDEVRSRISAGYAGYGPTNIPTPRIFFEDYPAGLVLSVPSEHIRLLLAYLNAGTYGGRQLLRPESVTQMLEPQVAMGMTMERSGGATHTGLIWMRGDLGLKTTWFGHGGAHMWGWHNDFRAYPELDLAVAVTTNRWDVPASQSGLNSGRICSYVEAIAAAHVAEEGLNRPQRSWAWKRSYVVAVSFVIGTLYYLGVPDPMTNSMVEQMLAGVCSDPSASFDPDGFRAAVADLASVPLTMRDIDEFMSSERCPLSRAEFNAIWSELDGRGPFPIPVPKELWADYQALGSGAR